MANIKRNQSILQQKNSSPSVLCVEPAPKSSFLGLVRQDERSESFTCLNSNNAAEKTKSRSIKQRIESLVKLDAQDSLDIETLSDWLTPYARKSAFSLKENVQKFISKVGLNNVGFLTLTFRENETDHKQAMKRFNSYRKHHLAKHYGSWMRVSERQKRGAWHFHILIDCKTDIRTGFDFDKVAGIGQRADYRSASKYLRHLWKINRAACSKYGFGTAHLFPIKDKAETMAKYVSKYLSKHNLYRDECDKGVRLVGYSSKDVRSSTQFSWHSEGGSEWRRKGQKFCDIWGIEYDDMSRLFGSKWGHKIRPFILLVDEFPPETVIKMTSTLLVTDIPTRIKCSLCGRPTLSGSRSGSLFPIRKICCSCSFEEREKILSPPDSVIYDKVHDQVIDSYSGVVHASFS